MKFKLQKSNVIAYFWLFIAVFTSASVVFSANQLWLVAALAFGVFWLTLKKNLNLKKPFLYFIGFLILITISQIVYFSYFPINTTLGTIVRFSLPYIILIFLGNKFVPYFIKFIYFWTVVGFIIYVPSVIFPSFYNFLTTIPAGIGLDEYGQGTNFLFYTVENDIRLGIRRFSNIFFEPGQYASYLILAMILNFYITKDLLEKKNLVFLIALILTFSTAGYIYLFLLIAIYLLFFYENKFLAIIPLVLLSFFGYQVYFEYEFLGEKIERQYEAFLVENESGYGRGSSRTVTTYNDFYASLRNPIIGLGRNENTRYEREILMDDEFITSNSTFDIAASFGYPFFSLYFTFIYLTFKYLGIYYNIKNRWLPYLFTFLIGLLYVSQTLYLHNSFLILLYLWLFLKKDIKTKNNSRNLSEFSSNYTYS